MATSRLAVPFVSPVLLTQAEAAALLRVTTWKVARERAAGRMAYIPGRPVLIRYEDVLDWLERRKVRRPDKVELAAQRADREREAKVRRGAIARHLRRTGIISKG